jgi:hypothetical protein
MNRACPHIRFATPTRHDEIHLWPDAKQIPADIQANRNQFANSDAVILGKPLHDWRETARQDIMALSRNYHEKLNLPIPNYPSEEPLLVTGHQPGFFHGGILVKYLLLDSLAYFTGGAALNLVADSDLPRDITLRIPTLQDERFALQEITPTSIDPHIPLEYQPLPEPTEFQNFLEKLQSLTVEESLGETIHTVVDVLRDIYPQCNCLTDLLVRLNQHWARGLAIQWFDLPVSHVAQSNVFLIFVADMILRAGEVRFGYNSALGQYRRIHKIHNASQPLPDLQGSKNQFETQELPFWVFQPDQPRQPLFVQTHNNIVILKTGNTEFAQLPIDKLTQSDQAVALLVEALHSNRMQIRPRALTLTAFARVFLADYFVHGIGGARYDHVTDEFLHQVYRIDPPHFAAATATVYLPLSQEPDLSRAIHHLRQMRYRWRDLKYNPQRYISKAKEPFSDSKSEILKSLVSKREKAIRTSDQLRRDRADRRPRREMFDTIRRLNAEILALAPHLWEEFMQQISRAQIQVHQARLIHDREYFFGLVPMNELRQLKQNLTLQTE